MSELKVNSITDASGGNTASINGATPTTDNTMGRNRIINGDMRIDQRNAGASATITATTQYTLDRWRPTSQNATSVMSCQQVTDAPAGFVNSLKMTSLASTTPGASESYAIFQAIEGYNIADLGWGTANAKTVTLSFWVRSSVTGTYSGAINNSTQNRSYPFTYSISSADAWEYKTVTIPGDTTGTWSTDTSIGIRLWMSLGNGANLEGTAGAWAAANSRAATGEVNWVATNGATFYITGVQLEAGSVATSFERVDYGEMLRRCQRYFQIISTSGRSYTSDGYWGLSYPFKVTMRAVPTYTDGPSAGNSGIPVNAQGIISATTDEAGIQWNGVAATYYAYAREATFNAEL